MSEYQYIHFLSCDRALSDAEMQYMQAQSNQARVSRWEFTNEYHYGDFHGDSLEMMRRGYDAHLHFANFGLRKVMFRLPEIPGGKSVFALFAVQDRLTWEKDKRGPAGVLTLSPGEGLDSWQNAYVDGIPELLAQLIPLRASLLRGDLRTLYIAWLACQWDEDAVEPPIPPGLEQLDESLRALAQFHELPQGLLNAAATESEATPKLETKDTAADRWIRGLKKNELKRIVCDLADGDATDVRSKLIAQARQAFPAEPRPMKTGRRTQGQLHTLGEAAEVHHRTNQKRKEERAKARRLAIIAKDPSKTLAKIDSLVESRTMRGYHAAADCLDELAAAIGGPRGAAKSRAVAEELRRQQSTSRILVGVLRKRDWIS